MLNKKPFYALANHIDRIPSLKCKSGVLLWSNLNTVKYAIYQRTKSCILRRVFSLSSTTAVQEDDQISMLDLRSQQVAAALESINVETLTPIEAMNELYKLKKMLN